MNLSVVTFHFPTDRWAKEPHEYGGLRPAYTELIPFYIDSIRRQSPRSTTILLTDESYGEMDHLFDRVDKFRIDEKHLMLERLRCQRAFRAENEGPIVFLDTDILVLRPLEDVFAFEFDLAVTTRDQPRHPREIDMPYNNGVWFLRGENRSQEVEYLSALIAAVEAMPEEAYAWGGNQLAVLQLLGRHEAWSRFDAMNLDVLILPCTKFNHAPSGAEDEIGDRYIMQFHGSYKDLMPEFARRAVEGETHHPDPARGVLVSKE